MTKQHTGLLQFLNVKTQEHLSLNHHGKGYFSFPGKNNLYKEETLKYLSTYRVVNPEDTYQIVDPRDGRGSGRGSV